MIIKPPKPGLGFVFWDLGFWDLVWLGLGVAIELLSDKKRLLQFVSFHNYWNILTNICMKLVEFYFLFLMYNQSDAFS